MNVLMALQHVVIAAITQLGVTTAAAQDLDIDCRVIWLLVKVSSSSITVKGMPTTDCMGTLPAYQIYEPV